MRPVRRASVMRRILVRDLSAAWAEASGSAAVVPVEVSPRCSAAALTPLGAGGGPMIRPSIQSRAWRAVSAGGRSVVAHSNCPTVSRFRAKGIRPDPLDHFHPSGKAQMEKSTVGLYFASGPPTQAFTTIQLPPLFGVFEGIDIPPGQERYTVKDSFISRRRRAFSSARTRTTWARR